MLSYLTISLMSRTETKGKTLEQMDELFGDQLVPHALEDPQAAAIAMEKAGITSYHEEVSKQ